MSGFAKALDKKMSDLFRHKKIPAKGTRSSLLQGEL